MIASGLKFLLQESRTHGLKVFLLGWPLVLVLGMALDLWVWDRPKEAGQTVTSQVRFGENEMAPAWMPKEWIHPFLKEIRHELREPIFSRDLKEFSQVISASAWVQSVDTVNRDFKGHSTLVITARKPVCVIRRKDGLDHQYLDKNLVEMPVLNIKDPEKLLGETLPIVHVGALLSEVKQDQEKWLVELVKFIGEWNNSGIQNRLMLQLIDMVPYHSQAARVCFLKLTTQDLKFKHPVVIEWGAHQEFNALEERELPQKWADLHSTIAQDWPFSSLDLRHKVPDIAD